jgi:HEAT repeat protein
MVIIVAFWFLLSMLRRETSFANNPVAARQTLLLFDNEHQSPTELLPLVESLSDNNQEVREGSRRRIVALGKQSTENRQVILSELLRQLRAPDFRDRTMSMAGSNFWVEAARILGDLNAVEAIDFLIDCISCGAATQYASDRYHHRPAVGALIVLGEPAVPKLVQTLTNPDPQIRIYAAVCLGNIQGRAARQALTEALSIEPDGDVQEEIRISIAAIDRGV